MKQVILRLTPLRQSSGPTQRSWLTKVHSCLTDRSKVDDDTRRIPIAIGFRSSHYMSTAGHPHPRPRMLTTDGRHGNLDPIMVGVFNAWSIHLTHLVHIIKAPHYLTDIIPSAQSSTWLGLWSADTAAYVKLQTRAKFGERGFRFAGPDTWNSLPSHLYCISDTADFKCKLKTDLFRQMFHQW